MRVQIDAPCIDYQWAREAILRYWFGRFSFPTSGLRFRLYKPQFLTVDGKLRVEDDIPIGRVRNSKDKIPDFQEQKQTWWIQVGSRQ